jgi:hypothetical protein
MATMSTTTGRLRRINHAPGDFLGADWSSRNRIVYQRRYVDDDLVDSIGIDLYAVNPAGGVCAVSPPPVRQTPLAGRQTGVGSCTRSSVVPAARARSG